MAGSDNHSPRAVVRAGTANRRRLLQCVGASMIGGLAGCLGEGNEDVLKIGCVVPTSGALGNMGEGTINGVELAVDEFDGTVDGRSVEVVARNSETDPGVASPAANELIADEGIDVLVGGHSSAVGLALQEIAEREQIVYVSQASSQNLSGENCNRYTFSHHASSQQFAGAPLIGYEEGLFDSMFFLPADFEGGLEAANLVSTALEEAGCEIAGESPFPLGNDDFSAQISDVRDSDADCCYFISAGPDADNFLSQVDGADLTDDVDVFFSFIDVDMADGAGSELMEGIYGGTSFYWETDGEESFTESYREEFGHAPRWFAAAGYDSAMELLSAIETEGTDPDAVVNFLDGREFDWTRECEWRSCDHRSIKPIHLLEGKAPGEMSGEDDYFDVVGSMTGEEIMMPCEDTGCNMDS